MEFNSRRIRVNDIELNVVVEGEGPDVLLLHGFPDDHAVWRRQIPALVAAGYRVIAPDTRGCGASEIAPDVRGYAIDQLVADLVALLDALGVGKARVVGHDWGAIQGWQLAIRHPERVERLVALSVGHPNAYARAGLVQKLRGYYVLLIQLRGLMEFLSTRSDFRMLRRLAGCQEEFPRWKALLSRPGRLTAGFNYYRANVRLLFAADYPAVRVPVVGAWSSGDRFLVERQMTNSGRYCAAGWRYERLDGPDHWLQLSAPGEVNALLLKHLA
ncbi:MAG: alpha/beta fold hydrolase [Gammaproteobacteria bacterium]|nr:alpha/beta fold hydrolase [Gammaproteobacteria bacterium]